MELSVPTNKIPSSESLAFRKASSASGPGMASKAIRAQEDNSGLGSSFAKSGTAAFEP